MRVPEKCGQAGGRGFAAPFHALVETGFRRKTPGFPHHPRGGVVFSRGALEKETAVPFMAH